MLFSKHIKLCLLPQPAGSPLLQCLRVAGVGGWALAPGVCLWIPTCWGSRFLFANKPRAPVLTMNRLLMCDLPMPSTSFFFPLPSCCLPQLSKFLFGLVLWPLGSVYGHIWGRPGPFIRLGDLCVGVSPSFLLHPTASSTALHSSITMIHSKHIPTANELSVSRVHALMNVLKFALFMVLDPK